jgi:hypothetical protein
VTISYFITGFNRRHPDPRLADTQRLELAEFMLGIPGLERAEIGVPAEVQTYHGDTPVPVLALRLDFAALPALERELAEGGRLHRLSGSTFWASLPLDHVSQQAMLRRCFLDRSGAGNGAIGCDYLVHYPGKAEELNAWLRYYLSHHAPIMTTYPNVRGVDVFTRIDWCDSLPWQRVAYMQRNRIAFDSTQDLLAALASPVREQMRQDHDRFPPYSDGSRHYPMLVTRVADSSALGDVRTLSA